MFEDFDLRTIEVDGWRLRVRIGGSGRPVLLLHGHPQTHMMWGRVAAELKEEFSLVIPDLPGYGDSELLTPLCDVPYSKREMGRALKDLMTKLDHPKFAVVGHDRGGRVAYRMALDHPASVEKLSVLDIVPTADVWRFAEHAGKTFGLAFWHWYFLAQPDGRPERIINAAPDKYYFTGDTTMFEKEALEDYRRCVRSPGTVVAMCADYRAGFDDELDEADRAAGRRIECPVLALWSSRDQLPDWFDIVETWKQWADDVTGTGIDAGHYLAEEAVHEVVDHVRTFLSR
jgi:haloacetate dehalogenase